MAPFVSTAELTSLLGGTLDSARATLAVTLATGVVQGAIGQNISQAPLVAVLHVTDPCDKWLKLPQLPAKLVTAVTIRGVAVTDYIVTPAELYRALGWAPAQVSEGEPVVITVAYTPGFATIPDDIKAAALFVASQLYSNPQLLQQVRIDDYSATRGDSSDILPAMLVEQLRSRYGTGVYVTGTR